MPAGHVSICVARGPCVCACAFALSPLAADVASLISRARAGVRVCVCACSAARSGCSCALSDHVRSRSCSPAPCSWWSGFCICMRCVGLCSPLLPCFWCLLSLLNGLSRGCRGALWPWCARGPRERVVWSTCVCVCFSCDYLYLCVLFGCFVPLRACVHLLALGARCRWFLRFRRFLLARLGPTRSTGFVRWP